MGRNSIKKNFKNKQKLYTKNNIYVLNLSIAQACELVDAADPEKAKEVFKAVVIGCTGCLIIAQLSVSARPENAEWVESLQSVKEIKQKILNNKMGLILSSTIGMALAFPYAMDDLVAEEEGIGNVTVNLIMELVESHGTNVKRTKPNKGNWLLYARGEMGAAKGQLISCPTTSLKTLNIDGSEVSSYGVQEAIKSIGFDESILNKYGITPLSILNEIRNILLTDNTGMPLKSLVYEEPDFVKSRIQNEIVGDVIVRNALIKNSLVKGVEPSFSISKALLNKFLNKSELFAYNIAIRTGDAQMAKKLSDIAIGRSKVNKE